MFWRILALIVAITWMASGTPAGTVVGLLMLALLVVPHLGSASLPAGSAGLSPLRGAAGVDAGGVPARCGGNSCSSDEGGGAWLPEWLVARLFLLQLADGTLTESGADALMRSATTDTIDGRRFPQEDRLVLLRAAVEVAAANGQVSSSERLALLDLADDLGVPRPTLDVLIGLVIEGLGQDRESSQLAEAYTTLGVQLGASIGEIRSAYRRLMKEHHPDKAAPSARKQATEKAAEINAAYDVLLGNAASAP